MFPFCEIGAKLVDLFNYVVHAVHSKQSLPEGGSQSRHKRDSRHCHHCFERCARRQRDRLRVLATSDPDLDRSAPMSNYDSLIHAVHVGSSHVHHHPHLR